MTGHLKRPYADWLLGGVMFLLCATLTVMQYRWTGEVARAEASRLRGNLDEQARALAQAFDAELAATCDQLRPQREDFADQTREAAHLARFKEWKAANPRPIFRRIALGVASGNEVQLSRLDQASAQFVPTKWPAEWSAWREDFNRRTTGGPPPSSDARGVWLEFPAFASGARREHWLILELDLDYARNHWLPELISHHLNPGSPALNHARIKLGGSSSNPLFATTTEAPRADDTVVSVRFNNLGRTTDRGPRGPSRDGGRWVLEAWQHRGALEAIVGASRRRNFAVAAGISLLMLATGLALIHFTRRSRRLAEQQMTFVASVSHELRTPLTVIRGAAHNLKRGLVQERAKIEEYSGLILQHAEDLNEMLEQLLALAGATKNRTALANQPTDLRKVLGEAIAAADHEIKTAGCSVQTELPATLPAVTGDATALRRAFQNLIVNAAKHGGAGGWIGVTANGSHDNGSAMVEVRVADHGPGIPEPEQAEIFKPFARGARAEAEQIRGSGLGLSLVREIVALHRGSISLDSRPGEGATFTVRLPASKEPA